MFRTTLAFFFLFLASVTSTFAQDLTQTVRGSVYDQDSHVPLIGATVVVLETDPIVGATTDVDGRSM
jgi:hypothetical protein